MNLLLCTLARHTTAEPYTLEALNFSTGVPQSIWGPGNAIVYRDENRFLGVEWDETVSFGEFIGLEPVQTGAVAQLTSTGRAGLEVSFAVDSGSVNAAANYVASLQLPDAPVRFGEFFSLNPLQGAIPRSLLRSRSDAFSF